MTKLLTIGMATYDDFDGAYFSTQALMLYHDILKNIDYEILIIDNNPNSPHSQLIQQFVGWKKDIIRYIPYNNYTSTAVRNEIFNNSEGKYTISIDCHVLLKVGGIEALLNYYEKNPNCKDIIQGPMLYDDQKSYATQFDPVWRGDMYGIWGSSSDKFNAGEPFEIPMMGLGLFSCEKQNWLGFNTSFIGFGGEEGYIHEKYRQNGGKAICIPQLQWMHRFGRPNGVKYRLILEDRVWNYFLGWLELTRNPEDEMIKQIFNHFKDRLPSGSIENIFQRAKAHYNL